MSTDRFSDDFESPADTAASRLLDEPATVEELNRLSATDRRRLADLQWLHSLLQQVFCREAQAREQRISRACLAIRDEASRVVQPATVSSRRRARWVMPAIVAASLMVTAVLIRGYLNPPTSAMAAVETTLKEANASPDRLYRLDTRWQPVLGGEPQNLNGDLWVRGNSHYLLRQNSALGDVFVGGNGREHWLIPPVGPVLVGGKRFEEALLGRPTSTPFLQVTSLLERLASRYELSLASEEELPAAEDKGTVRCTHVIGHRRDADDPLTPKVIELWTARQSGTAYRIKAVWSGDQPGPREMQLQLQPLTTPLPTGWYNHAAHHRSDRRVLQKPGTEDEL